MTADPVEDALRLVMAGYQEPPLVDVDPNGTHGRASRLGALSRADALARIESRPVEWIVDGILASTDYGVLAGPKGIGKTFSILDLGVAVALAEPWFGRFPTRRARALILTSEDSEARIWRRIDAIVRSRGREPAEVEGWLLVHPMPFSVIRDLDRFSAELGATEPGLVLIDPAYKYLSGAKASLLFDMGAVLTPLQVACADVRAALLLGHHYNRQTGAAREERLSGAGLLEWARVVITAEGSPRRGGDGTAVMVRLEVTGNSMDPIAFTVQRRVEALDDGPDPELVYSAEVVAEGAEAREERFKSAADRIAAVLPDDPVLGLTVKEIGDRVATDGTGKGLKASTIRAALRRDLNDRVDTDGSPGKEGRWWLA